MQQIPKHVHGRVEPSLTKCKGNQKTCSPLSLKRRYAITASGSPSGSLTFYCNWGDEYHFFTAGVKEVRFLRFHSKSVGSIAARADSEMIIQGHPTRI